MAMANLGKVYDRLGERDLAIFFLKLSVNSTQMERARLSPLNFQLRISYIRTVDDRYHRLFDILMRSGRTAEALDVLELLKEDEYHELDSLLSRTRAGSKDDTEAIIFLGTPDEPAYRAYSSEAETYAAIGAKLATIREKRGRVDLSSEEELIYFELNNKDNKRHKSFIDMCDNLQSHLGVTEGTATALRTLELQSRQETLRQMGEGTVIVHVVPTKDTLYTVLVTPDTIVHWETRIRREELTSLVYEFRNLLKDPRLDPRPKGEAIYDAMMRPLEDELKGAGARTIMLSLDGTLRYIPFAALWDGNKWFAESYPTSIWTESTVDKLREPGHKDTPTALAFGVTLGFPGFQHLKCVKEEISSIVRPEGTDASALSPGVLEGKIILDGEFTRDALSRGLASGVPVVHVASHFLLRPTNALETVLLLGDGTDEKSSTLSLIDIKNSADLDFRRMELLTLSACDTASGVRLGNGSELTSFATLVQRRGAHAVLASLWPVDDPSTSRLMREFYRLRYIECKDKAEALRMAQIAVMCNVIPVPFQQPGVNSSGVFASPVHPPETKDGLWNSPGFSHPYYWAPFIVMGNWR
jgi:CHAT domain-containing protein